MTDSTRDSLELLKLLIEKNGLDLYVDEDEGRFFMDLFNKHGEHLNGLNFRKEKMY